MEVPTTRLIAQQSNKITEIEAMKRRLEEKDRGSFNSNIVNMRMDTLVAIWAEARATHNEIISKEDDHVDTYLSDNIFTRLQTVYENTSDFLLTLLSEIAPVHDYATSEGSHSNGCSSAQPPIFAKLPRLELPKFSGRYDEWENFSDLFKALVHDIPNMSDSAKLISLQSCMKGRAIQILKGVSPSRARYNDVWAALNERFQNPRFIVYNELQNLMDVPTIKEESADQLRYFTDEVNRVVRVLSNLNMPVNQWDVWIIFLLASRLDPESRRAWETKLSTKDVNTPLSVDSDNPLQRFPTFKEFSSFLEQRARTLCMLSLDTKHTKSKTGVKRTHHAAFSSDNSKECPHCEGDHTLGKCDTFTQRKPHERRDDVRNWGLCFNCFGSHHIRDCKAKGRCRECRGKHHSLIHLDNYNSHARGNKGKGENSQSNSKSNSSGKNVKALTVSVTQETGVSANACGIDMTKNERVVLLATAQITIIGPRGTRKTARALLDQGSEASFISEALVKELGLPTRKVQTSLTGVGGCKAGSVKSATYFTLQSCTKSKFQLDMDAFVLPLLTAELPARSVLELDLAQVSKLSLADPKFYVSNPIDVLIGADFYGQLLRAGLKQLPNLLLTAQNTALGWVISGPVDQQSPRRAEYTTALSSHHCQTVNLDESLQRFWTLEEVPTSMQKLTPQEEACEKLFTETHSRDNTGRYVVRLPLKSDTPRVATETRRMAVGSLHHMQRRFARDPRLEKSYREFMEEYITLGHMKPVPPAEVSNPKAWYLPHHAVIQTSPKYKIRVVFDASRRTHEGHSLNSFLMPGPPLQRDLALILLNWRRYRYGFTGDLVKMFRQIGVVPADQDLLRIVWPPEAPIDWRLTTVTYGTTCAPYLAIRTLSQLASDEKSRLPLGASCLESNTYVDDIFAGADDLTTAVRIRDELVELLKSAGIELDKWAANHRDLLPSHLQSTKSGPIKTIDCDDSIKTLGVTWNPNVDQFNFSAIKLDIANSKITKRYVLSDTARLFDPLGYLTPITIVAKIIMQDLWIIKCDWDEQLPDKTRSRWLEYRDSLSLLPAISLNRWLGCSDGCSYEIHGFSDASSRAYAAVVYLRTVDRDGKVRVSVLSSKTKVAPVKTISIPNLELCGAALLVRLVKHLLKLDFLKSIPIFLRTDNKTVLKWLEEHPCKWKTFVANRVSFIQTELPSAQWSHVPTKENPADLATRGVTPSDLKDSSLWWHGPPWLLLSPENWPQRPKATTALQVCTSRSTDEFELLSRYSDLAKLIRVTAHCLRYIANRRRKKEGATIIRTPLTVAELTYARKALIRSAQNHAFAFEINLIKRGRPLPKGNALRKLNPIISKVDGLLCVGGRLSNSRLSYNLKHPPILPRNSALSVLFVRSAHHIALHGGPTLTTSMLIQQVWIVGMRPLVKTAIRTCVKCQRHKPHSAQQLMGDLPEERVTPARPFTTTGLDYAGPFQIRCSKGRGQKSEKGYIALFVCFATKAVHLEAVSDLTTATFLLAFERFTNRRGKVSKLCSDNATTFRGADTELKAMFNAASDFYQNAAKSLAFDGTTWDFIPPSAPHYGGLWEAGVKSVKHLLKRSIGDHKLTFEEFTTVLSRIEACLNSRPLCPFTGDPDDLNVLTPAHFLIGSTTTVIPDREPPNVPENRLNRFQLMQQMRNQFWKQWSRDYLQHLQERNKWRTPAENYGVGQLVLVKDDRYPPAKWPLGRVIEVHPGKDNLVRVVTVKTPTSTYRRHINRLSPLLIDEPAQEIINIHHAFLASLEQERRKNFNITEQSQ